LTWVCVSVMNMLTASNDTSGIHSGKEMNPASTKNSTITIREVELNLS
jgi:hypothetical protein